LIIIKEKRQNLTETLRIKIEILTFNLKQLKNMKKEVVCSN